MIQNILIAIGSIVSLLILLFVFKAVKWARLFFKYYDVLVFDKEALKDFQEDNDLLHPLSPPMPEVLGLKADSYEHSMDLRGTPTHVCPCGSNIWNLKVMFEDFEISSYLLDMECVSCGSVATAPTAIDKKEDM